MTKIFKFFSLFCFSTLLLTTCKLSKPLVEVAREELGVSILSINIYGIMNVPLAPTGSPWHVRYARIYDWMKETKNFPDIIVVQEAHVYWKCISDPERLKDYAAIDFLLDGIKDATGEQYRIAYMIAQPEGGTNGNDWVGPNRAGSLDCRARGGRLLLYRSSKLRNKTVTASQVGLAHDAIQPLDSTYLINSVPCCNPTPLRADVCDIIDGTWATNIPNGCTRVAAAGSAWTRTSKLRRGSEHKYFNDAIFSRFELVKQPGNFIHIYNVHRAWSEKNPLNMATIDTGSININRLVADMESRFATTANPTLYPPILVGDFNVGTDVAPSYFPLFDIGGFSTIDGVMIGKPLYYPSKQKAFTNIFRSMPELMDGESCETSPNVWSDHCGVFFRIEPSLRTE